MDMDASISRMLVFLKRFERAIVTVLIVLMVLVIALATIEVGWLILQDITSPPVLILEIDELLDIFGKFLLVLVGIELLYTLRAYWAENEVHVEVVFAMALIAVARKVIVLDVKDLDSMVLIGIAAVVLALSVGYYYVGKHIRTVCEDKRSRGCMDGP
ncbi:MAG TPA: phosphate-starvation-inducible PsiE family protein [Deltaproteobacteria bacterium]|nr:phosphate-starvation-inducible PsiE family protein [Deltaproteobacteria bacterium]HPH51227.1 phosphate-starvation-inducible PsiE family protein [Deltaproteobacteria bacterium]HPJ06710.1 phosphate-starvation-inducible PsiE family protein [Deltaproteobacteria bacterium]